MLLPAQIIQQKRDGQPLSADQIRFFIDGFTRGVIPDYQMAALAMAICFQGMNTDETLALTRAMVESGQTLHWPRDGVYYADKHSTGGIGDKVSLLLAPLVAACGIRVPMLSGRGLGPTGGTLDKLESVPGLRTDLPLTEFQRITLQVGCCISGTTDEIAPADRKLYALRDVTATVSCQPLIVASIMSKKLAENVDGLVLDVKWGSGAFMKTQSAAVELAQAMVEVGRRYGKAVVALVTDMNQPLGTAIGNALEVRECVDVLLRRAAPADLVEVTFALATEMLILARIADNPANARQLLQRKLIDGAAHAKFLEMVSAQGGTTDMDTLPLAKFRRPIPATVSGYVQAIAADQIGYAVIALGGGRKVAGERIDHAVGFTQPKKIGALVTAGEPLLWMHYNNPDAATAAEALVRAAYQIGPEPPPPRPPLIAQRIA